MTTIHLNVLYFASARDVVGKRGERLSVDGTPTVTEFVKRIHALHPGLKAFAGSTRYAVNLEVVDGDSQLHDGDEVGVLPAVAGG